MLLVLRVVTDKRRREAFGRPLIDHDHTALDHNLCIQHIPIALQRIAAQENNVRKLTLLQRPEIVAHLDVRCGVRSHELDDVLH